MRETEVTVKAPTVKSSVLKEPEETSLSKRRTTPSICPSASTSCVVDDVMTGPGKNACARTTVPSSPYTELPGRNPPAVLAEEVIVDKNVEESVV